MKLIRVSCCRECPLYGECRAWKMLSIEQVFNLTIGGVSTPKDFILKECHLVDED